MEIWQLMAREEIRDLVSRYNANGDTGRLAQVRALFAPDAVLIVQGQRHEGIEAVMEVFTGATLFSGPSYVRHFTATHQIDLVDEGRATGRCYFAVLTDIGLDHWGRYVDEYRRLDNHWVFASRSVTLDGQVSGSRFPRTVD